MGEMGKDLTGIAMAIVGVAILTVILRPGSNTVPVIGAATSGFANALSVAMGGASPMGGMSSYGTTVP